MKKLTDRQKKLTKGRPSLWVTRLDDLYIIYPDGRPNDVFFGIKGISESWKTPAIDGNIENIESFGSIEFVAYL